MDFSSIEFKLEEIGLTKAEIKVYLALLELGSSTTGPIIDKSQTANSKIYQILEKLIQKGLVTFYKQEGLRYYKATPPISLLRYLKEKQEQIREQENQIKQILPTLEAFHAQQEEEKEALVFKGPKGIKTAFHDVVDTLKKGETVNIMAVYNFGQEYKRLAHYFQKIRAKKGIKARYMIAKSGKPVADLFSNYPPIEIRFMKESLAMPSIFIIYKNKVIISLGDEMIMFMIKSERVADTFRMYFEQLWPQATPYLKKEALKRAR
ncbi:MAG: helix-turn-helix domain-containing protein [Nanoarchaeota archaeon]